MIKCDFIKLEYRFVNVVEFTIKKDIEKGRKSIFINQMIGQVIESLKHIH